MTKKIVSVLLVLISVMTMFTLGSVTTSADTSDLPEVAEGCNRYFFLMPEDWYNEYTDTAGIYWWDGSATSDEWPGYKALEADAEGIFYYDVPEDVTNIIWNNYLDGGLNIESIKYKSAMSTTDVSTEFYEDGENYEIFKDLTDFENMIYVVDPEKSDMNTFRPTVFFGDWYYYYGNGEYGTEKPSATLPEVAEGCNRYFFYMPDTWVNDYTNTAGVHMYTSSGTVDEFPGCEMNKTDVEGVFYYDVPDDCTGVVFNNFLDGGTDIYQDVYGRVYRTEVIDTDGYDPGESSYYPNGLDSLSGMIYVIDMRKVNVNHYDGRLIFHGDWYYYYGNGEFGVTPVKGDGAVYSDPYGISWHIDSYIVGDADKSLTVNIKDATAIQKKIADMEVPHYKAEAADANRDDTVNIKDATEIQKYIAGIEAEPSVGKEIFVYMTNDFDVNLK